MSGILWMEKGAQDLFRKEDKVRAAEDRASPVEGTVCSKFPRGERMQARRGK